MRFLYVVIAYLLAPVVVGAMFFRGFRDRSHWRGFSQRFGFGRRLDVAGSIWVHAVSVGEVQASVPLVHALLERFPGIPIVVTTVTPTGQSRAQALFGTRVDVRYLALDLPGSVRRFFDRVRPRLAVILETELWPNLYRRCGQLGVPLVLASARISPRSVARYRTLASLFRETLSHGISIAAQSADDAERFRSIGANPARTHVVGNIKFDFGYPPGIEAQGRELREMLGKNRPVWIAGSTHEKEEDIVLDAHRGVREQHPDALLVLVPRHPPRFAEVVAAVARTGFRYVTRTSRQPMDAGTAVFVLDTLGELAPFYAASDVAFVGGSLVPIGGHNLLEPASLARPVLAGPHNFNSADIARLLAERGVLGIVHDAGELATRVNALIGNPAERERLGNLGRVAVDDNRGAVARVMTILEPLIEGSPQK
jgi:3-deoxy-D-manno-octulosonic-acid transferase